MLYNKISSIIIGVFLTLIFIGYNTNFLLNIPCDNNLISKFTSNFVHIDSIHLILNLLGLFIISNFEREIGTTKFISIVLSISVILTILETIFLKRCSIGFSGILFGLFTYKMVHDKQIDYEILITLILMFLFTTDRKICHISHMLGIITGLFVAYLFENYIEN